MFVQILDNYSHFKAENRGCVASALGAHSVPLGDNRPLILRYGSPLFELANNTGNRTLCAVASPALVTTLAFTPDVQSKRREKRTPPL
jgi:hypothetical protein